MADDSAKPAEGSELSKDVLAPVDGPRENLVATAVKFLQNPKVRQSPLSQKKTFLESKGLTADEVQLAIDRAGVADSQQSSEQLLLTPQHPHPYPNTALLPQPPLPPPLPVSPWTRTKEIVSTAAIVAAVSYAVYNVFKNYIRPWLQGKNETEARLQRMENSMAQLQATVADTNAQMIETLRVIQDTLTAQRENSVQGSEISLRQETRALNEVKAEVTSLKSLLLNRRQFPPPPVTSPLIPAWQKSAVLGTQTKASSTEQDTETGGEAAPSDINAAQSAEGGEEEEKQGQEAADGNGILTPNPEPTPTLQPQDEDAQTAATESVPVAASPSSASSNNGFEMVRTTSDSDTPADLD